VGLNNVARRLALQYGATAEFSIRSAPGLGTTVELSMPAERSEPREPALARTAR
jgi:sensor histidine kinase YesM